MGRGSMDILEKEEQGAVMPSAMSENEEVLSAGEKSQENISKKRKRQRRNKESYILTVRSRGEKILFAIVFVIFVVYAASLIYPFIWMFLGSLKTSTEYTLDGSQGRPFAFPDAFYFGNYAYAFTAMEYEGTNLFGMFFNSIWQSAINLFGGLFASAALAYVLSRFKFVGRTAIYTVIIFTMTIPIVGNTGGYYKLVSDIGIYNTPFFSLLTSFNGIGLGFLILYAFFSNISKSYAEAVYIDGGGEWTVYFKIMIPQAMPALLTLTIVNLIGVWNDYQTPLLYLPSFPTIASGMYVIKTSLLRTGKDPIYYAGIILSIIPVLIVFCCFSNTIMKNMAIGGLKG